MYSRPASNFFEYRSTRVVQLFASRDGSIWTNERCSGWNPTTSSSPLVASFRSLANLHVPTDEVPAEFVPFGDQRFKVIPRHVYVLVWLPLVAFERIAHPGCPLGPSRSAPLYLKRPSAWAGCVRGPCFKLPTPSAGLTARSNWPGWLRRGGRGFEGERNAPSPAQCTDIVRCSASRARARTSRGLEGGTAPRQPLPGTREAWPPGGMRISSGANHGRKSSKFNRGCTICASCPCPTSASADLKWRGNRLKLRESRSSPRPICALTETRRGFPPWRPSRVSVRPQSANDINRCQWASKPRRHAEVPVLIALNKGQGANPGDTKGTPST